MALMIALRRSYVWRTIVAQAFGQKSRGGLPLLLWALSLVGILIAGLWPFGQPLNEVARIEGSHAVRLGEYATIFAKKAFTGNPRLACTVEMNVRPALSRDSSTLISFYAAGHEGLSLHQSWSDFRADVQTGSGRRATYGSDVFRAGRIVFLTVTAGPNGTSLFVNGLLVGRRNDLQPSEPLCTGSLIVGDSPRQPDSWLGELSGLAIYEKELTDAEALLDYRSWHNTGWPEEHQIGLPAALYLFDEQSGSTILDRGLSGTDLFIPVRYSLTDAALLASPTDAFLTWDYARDSLVNIGGFIPFGFLTCTILNRSRWSRRRRILGVLTGLVISLLIEVLQSHLPTRHSDMTDVLTNTLGSGIGAALHRHSIASFLAPGYDGIEPMKGKA